MPVSYSVGAEAFYRDLAIREAHNIALTEQAMKGLVARYGLSGKRILSLGSGNAFEEFWFHRAGCALVLNDIDPPHLALHLAERLSALPPGDLTFHIEDADATISRYGEEFDALYVSGFHPDEARRASIQEDFKARRSPEQASQYITWPAGEKPYHPTLTRALNCVRRGGLAIFQHYYGGVYVDANAHYVDDLARHFRSAGFRLREVYCFRQSPAHLLVIASKGWRPIRGPDVVTFHGRYSLDLKTDIMRVFPPSDGRTSKRA